MKKLIKTGIFVLTGFVLQASVASAHHAVQAQFDVQKIETFTGVMTDVELINPHPYLFVPPARPRHCRAMPACWRRSSHLL